jgi:hypothetical protein
MISINKSIPYQITQLAKGKSVNDMTEIVNILRNLNFDKQYFNVSYSPSGINISFIPDTSADDKYNFTCTLSGSTVTVKAGNIKLHGIGSYRVEKTDITLTGSPDWVYLFHNRDHSASGIDHLVTPDSTGPESDTNILRIPLVKCEFANGAYDITEWCFHGDYQADAPIR